MAVRWYLAYPLSSRQVLELLGERGIDVSHRTILTWAQVFGPLLAVEVRRRRRVGGRWFVDEVFLFRKSEKRYLYRAIDEDGVVVDVLRREHRDTASAEGFFRQAIERAELVPEEVVTDHHQPHVKAVATTCPGAQHIRTGCIGRAVRRPKRSNAATCPCAIDCATAVDSSGPRPGSAFWKASKRCARCRPPGAWPSASRARPRGRSTDPYPGAGSASTALNALADSAR